MPVIPAVFVIVSSLLSLTATVTTLIIANRGVKMIEIEVNSAKEKLESVQIKAEKAANAAKKFAYEITDL